MGYLFKAKRLLINKPVSSGVREGLVQGAEKGHVAGHRHHDGSIFRRRGDGAVLR